MGFGHFFSTNAHCVIFKVVDRLCGVNYRFTQLVVDKAKRGDVQFTPVMFISIGKEHKI